MVTMHGHERFLELLERDYERLERFALSLTRRREDARELLAQSIAAAMESFNSLRNEQAFLAYMFSILSRTHTKTQRQQRRHIPHDPESMQELYAGGLSAEDAYDLHVLYQAIERLPENYREVFMLAEIAEMSHKDIAQQMSISLASVKVRVFRAKQLLRRMLGVTQGEAKPSHKQEMAHDSNDSGHVADDAPDPTDPLRNSELNRMPLHSA